MKLDKPNFFKFYHKKYFKLLDTLFVLGLIFNIGALFLTNVLVVANNPNIQVLESNPTAAKLHDFEVHPEASSLYKSFVIQMCMYFVLFICFYYFRSHLHTNWQLVVMLSTLTFFAFVTGLDFFNNLGYFVGKLSMGWCI